MNGDAKEPKDLTSWKEIAQYLGITVRTAQRWELERGLPVWRTEGPRGHILARTDELDRWQESLVRSPRPWNNLRLLQVYSAATTTLLLALVTAGFMRWRESTAVGKPERFRADTSHFAALDAAGREVWRYRFPFFPNIHHYNTEVLRDNLFMGDLDGNGSVETVLHVSPGNDPATGSEVLCISEQGEVLWRFTPDRALSDRGRKYDPVFGHRTMRVFNSPERGGRRWIAVASVHQWGHPSQLAVLDAGRRMRGEYWNTGHLGALEAVDLDGDGIDEILAGGVDESRDQAVLRIFDPRRVAGTTKLPSDHPLRIQGLSDGTEIAIVRFPRSKVNLRLQEFNVVESITPSGSDLMVKVREHVRTPHAHVLYVLDHGLKVKSAQASISFPNLLHQVAGDKEMPALLHAEVASLASRVEVWRQPQGSQVAVSSQPK